MNKDAVILFASSRSNGHTKKALENLFAQHNLPIIDLKDKNISFFDYEARNNQDDFIPLVEELVDYKTIIFASPTYWYSMCAQMKIFFDRISDLYNSKKDLLEKLQNKNVFVVTSFGSSKPLCFEKPFQLTAEYLKMKYHTCYFYYSGSDKKLKESNKENQEDFLKKFNSLLNN